MSDSDTRQLHGDQIAYRIRAELVCCDIYDRVQRREAQHPEVNGSNHTLCYWGEAAAQLAETPADWQDAPDGCAQGCPAQCRHRRAADELTRMDEDIALEYGEITAARLEGSCSASGKEAVPNTLTPGAPRPDDPDWNSPEDATYDQHQEQQ